MASARKESEAIDRHNAARMKPVAPGPKFVEVSTSEWRKVVSDRDALLAALERFAKGDYGAESVRIAKAALAKARGA